MVIELVVNNENDCIINGFLTREYINKVITLGESFISQANSPVIDLDGVTACDSSGVAVLVYWWGLANKYDKKLILKNLSRDMLAIIKVSNVENILTVAPV